ncbi:MAG TPA: LytR C-terminal domain-containing protein, partial [Actinomycetales bacterium]
MAEAPDWRRRRRLRQQVTMAFVVVLVTVAGLVASGLYLGWISTGSAEVAALPACPPPVRKPVLPAPKQVAVNVYNGSTREGLATSTAKAMRGRGFVVKAVANDPKRKRVAGTAVVRHGPKGLNAAKVVAGVVAGATLERDARADATVDLVVGGGFDGVRPAPKPKPKPAAT